MSVLSNPLCTNVKFDIITDGNPKEITFSVRCTLFHFDVIDLFDYQSFWKYGLVCIDEYNI